MTPQSDDSGSGPGMRGAMRGFALTVNRMGKFAGTKGQHSSQFVEDRYSLSYWPEGSYIKEGSGDPSAGLIGTFVATFLQSVHGGGFRRGDQQWHLRV